MMKARIKNLLRNSRFVGIIFKIATCICNRISLGAGSNRIDNDGGVAYRCKICIRGQNNRIIIGDFARIVRCKIIVHGNYNVIEIGKNAYIEDSAIIIEFDNNSFLLGGNCIISRGFEGSCMEGTAITIGNDCLFSGNIQIRTSDSHSILDMNGNRTNKSKSVHVGNHVWIGSNALLLKGSEVKDDCIVGARSVLVGKYEAPHAVIAGQPARIVKENVSWDKRLLRMEEE